MTEWAPLWFGLLSDDEQDNIKEQIRGSNIFESKGLKEIDMGDQLTELLSNLETDSKHSRVSSYNFVAQIAEGKKNGA